MRVVVVWCVCTPVVTVIGMTARVMFCFHDIAQACMCTDRSLVHIPLSTFPQQTKGQASTFIATLDYIFVSPAWRVCRVGSLPTRKRFAGILSLPTVLV